MSDIAVPRKRQRIAWIDIAKGITILTVIWGHTLTIDSSPRNLIFCFHMPLFFILSGFTLKPVKNKKDLIVRTKKDFFRLIVPVVLILITTSILNIALRASPVSTEVHNLLYRLFWANGVSFADGLPAMGMPWFLVALFISKLILRLLSLLFRNGFELVGTLCGFVGVALGVKHIWLPFNLDMALVCMIFVAGGMLAHKYLSIFSKYHVLIFILSLFFVYSMLSQGRYIELAAHSYDLSTIIEGFAASFIICVICNSVSSNSYTHKVLCFIGINTMPVFLVHHLDMFFSFLYANDNMYIKCIFRTFYVLLYAWAFSFLFRIIKRGMMKLFKPKQSTN